MEVQNRIQSVLPQLPQEVRDLGITVRKGSTETLLIVHMFATDPSVDRKYIANYASLQVRERLLRTPGVGDVTTNAARDYAMRVWIDPERAAARDLTVQEIVTALRNSNMQVAGGAIGAPPFNNEPAAYQLNVRAQGRLESPEEFADAIIKRDAQGRVTRVGRCGAGGAGRAELRAERLQEPRAGGVAVGDPGAEFQCAGDRRQHPSHHGGTQARVPAGRGLRDHLQPGVVHAPGRRRGAPHAARGHAAGRVVVVLLFLQRWRTALIPLVAIPVSLVGSLAVMSAFGFSLNNLSMFALVLSIGIVVDDAIVVVENVERHLRAGMAPREAARLTMDEVGGALIGIALVLVAVFVPTAFMGGITGQFYKQFALTIAAATVISLIVSLTLSPAMAAALLKPHDPADAHTGVGPQAASPGARRMNALDGSHGPGLQPR